MANKKIVSMVEIQGNISDLQKKVSSARELIKGLEESGNAPKSLISSFGKVERILESIKSRTKDGIFKGTDAEFQSLIKQLREAGAEFSTIGDVITKIGGMDDDALSKFLNKEDLANFKKANQLLSEYQAILESINKGSKRKQQATESVEAAKTGLKQAKERKEKLSKATPEQQGAADELKKKRDEVTRLQAEVKRLQAERKKLETQPEYVDNRDEQERVRGEIQATKNDLTIWKRKKRATKGPEQEEATQKVAQLEQQLAGSQAELSQLQAASRGYSQALAETNRQLAEQQELLRTVRASETEYLESHQSLIDGYELSEQALEQAEKEIKKWTLALQKAEAEEKAAIEADSGAIAGEKKEVFQKLSEAAKQLGISMEQLGLSTDGTGEDIKKLMDAIRAKNQTMLDAIRVEDGYKKEIDETNGAIQGAIGATEEAAEAQKKLNEQTGREEDFSNRVKQFLGIAGAAKVMRTAMQDAMRTISELDATMGEMAVVTDLSVGDYWDQLPEYSKQASELGVSINSAYKAATLYYQQGLKSNEVTKISAETLKMAKIAGLDTADATDKMTAALRGFNMELNETSAQRISDVYSQLAAITAADVSEISSAMTKTASIASSAGMEFETTAAFLSQIIETTRESAETAGTAMKTVIARFQELKKDPNEIGEVEGEIVDANAIETALRSVGVSLRDASGQFRDLDDVFLELSSKWDSLDKNTQRYIATIAAGSRQQSRFIAMMQNYSRTQELVSEANNSAGASQKQFAKTMETLESKLENLKNSWHEFTMGILDSDAVKFGVDVLNKLLEIVNKATSGFDGMFGSLNKIMSVLAIFKLGSKLFEKFRQPLTSFFAEVVVKAREAGEDSARAFDEGARTAGEKGPKSKPKGPLKKNEKLKKGYTIDSEGRVLRSNGELAESGEGIEKIGFWERAGEYTGVGGIVSGSKELKAIGGEARRNHKQLKYKRQELKSKKRLEKTAIKFGDEASVEEYRAQIKEIEKELDVLEDKEAEFKEASSEAWSTIGSGVQKVGEGVSNIGLFVSMIGGMLSAMGLEEQGELISQIGGGILMVGSALQAIPPILTLITSHPIILVITLIIGVIITLVTVFMAKSKELEKGVENAAKAAENASKAADAAAESYDNLSSSLESLGDKYKNIENLTRGTKEWNEAVQEINSSVLDLVDQYPELAQFVQNLDGVLTLDMDSQGVQDVLKKAEAQKITAKNESILANVALSKAEDELAFSKLSEDAKLSFETEYVKVENDDGTSKVVSQATQETVDRGLEDSLDAKNTTQVIAQAMASGEAGTTRDSLQKYLEEEMGMVGQAAKEVAIQMWDNRDALISYGRSVNETEQQQKMAFDSIATSAQSLANTMFMTEEEIKQSNNLVDGEISEQYYNEKMAELGGLTQDKNGSYGAYQTQVDEAIKRKYGPHATIGEGGVVTYRDGDKDATVTLTDEEIKQMIATQYATDKAAGAIEASDEAIAGAAAAIGENAIGNLYNQKEGRGLTKADMDTLSSALGEGFSEKWVGLSEEEKQAYKNDPTQFSDEVQLAWKSIVESGGADAYGNDITKFVDDLANGVEYAKDAFEKAGDSVQDFMTADMAKGFSDKLAEVAAGIGGEAAAEAVKSKTAELLQGKTDETKQEIQARINATDWSNTESLIALQLDLEKQYGYSEKEAKEYIGTLKDAAYATSKLKNQIPVYGEYWKATEKIKQSMQKLTQLQWEYNKALEGGSGSIQDSIGSMLEEYKKQGTWNQNAFDQAKLDLDTVYARGGEYEKDLREAVTIGEFGIMVDESRLEEYRQAGMSQESIDQWLADLEEQYQKLYGSVDGVRSSIDEIEKLEQQSKDAYDKLRETAETTIAGSLQKQIDLQQDTLDATRDANAQLINKIQEQIDTDRQQREKEESEKNLSNLHSQLSYLTSDTSGMNDLQRAETEKTLQEAERDYQDSLIDQSLQTLQDSTAKAEEQRERQIALAQQQLNAYMSSAQFQDEVDRQLKEMLAADNWMQSNLGQQIYDNATAGMNAAQINDYLSAMEGTVGLSEQWETQNWSDYKTQLYTKLDAMTKALGNIPNFINSQESARQVDNLVQAGFDKTSLEGITKDGVTESEKARLGSLESFSAKEGSKEAIETQYSNVTELADKAGISTNIKTQSEYYSDVFEASSKEGFDPNSQNSYLDYLKGEEASLKGRVKAKALENAKNAMNMTAYNEALQLYTSAGGTEAVFKQQTFSGLVAAEEGQITIDPVPYDVGKGWLGLKYSSPEKCYIAIPKSDGDKAATWRASELAETALNSLGLGAYSIGYYKQEPYFTWGDSKWYKLSYGHSEKANEKYDLDGGYQAFKKRAEDRTKKRTASTAGNRAKSVLDRKYNTYKTGGLADFTGPAWLDGTPTKPEYILNAQQTERFFSLIDVLEGLDSKESGAKPTGDNYFDIDINVEKIEDDYDLEQIANKIRGMIYQDATYRNVNSINLIR